MQFGKAVSFAYERVFVDHQSLLQIFTTIAIKTSYKLQVCAVQLGFCSKV